MTLWFCNRMNYLTAKLTHTCQKNYALWRLHVLFNLESQNKRPKGPKTVHLSTICHLFDGQPLPPGRQFLLCCLRSIATHRDHFVRRLAVRLSVCPSVTLFCHTFQSYVSQATHAFLGMLSLFFTILLSSRKNTNLVRDVEILLLINFRRIPFNGFRGEVENVSASQRQSCFSG